MVSMSFDPPSTEPINRLRQVTPHSAGAHPTGRAIAVPGAVAWLGPADPVVHAVMIEHVRRSGVGRDLVERAAALIGAPDTRTYPPLVLAAGDSSGVHVLVHGPLGVGLDTVGPDGTRRRESLSSEIGDPIVRTFARLTALQVGPPPGRIVTVDPLDELGDGVIAASGLTVSWGHPTEPASAPPEQFRSTPPLQTAQRQPEPTSPPPQTASPRPSIELSVLGGRPSVPPRVAGLLCSRQHFNDPAAHFCAHCGIAMHQASFVLIERPRPPLGILRFDTGEAFELASDLSIGREPLADSLVTSGLARALTPSGDVSGLSRVHASMHLEGWTVLLSDRGSLNGTFLWDRQQRRWNRLAPDTATPIRPGDMIGFGRRAATFETSIRTP